MKVLYLTTANAASGIGQAGRANAQALRAQHEVVHHLQDGVNAIIQHGDAIAMLHQASPTRRWPAATAEGIPTVGYCVVEGDSTRKSIDRLVQKFHQLWTPSQASYDALLSSGVRQPIKIIPHVLWPFQSIHSPPRDQPFTVLTCGHLISARKGQHFAHQMFQTAFPAEKFPDVRLLIKTRAGVDRLPADFARMMSADPRIHLIAENVTEMTSVYDQGHVLLSAHLAGAFELHVAEAAAYGMPVIASATGGPLDYLHGSSLITIADRREFELPVHADPYNHALYWDVPDIHEGAAMLRACLDDYERHRITAQTHSTVVRQHCAPARIAALMDNALQELPRVTWHEAPTRRLKVRPFTPFYRTAEIYGKNGALARVGVHSHRRSGTHLTGALVEQGWQCAWAKNHVIDASSLTAGIEWIHAVRNPVDCIYKTWVWWAGPGNGAANPLVREALQGLTFEQFLNGEGGPRLGWRPHSCVRPVDNLGDLTGYFYDPLLYWADHTRAAMLHPRMPSVVYERTLRDPGILEAILTPLLGPPIKPLTLPQRAVGHRPHMDAVGHALQFWPESHLRRLAQELSNQIHHDRSILDQLGFASLDEWIETGASVTGTGLS